MPTTLAIVNDEDYTPDITGSVLLLDLRTSKHYFYSGEFKPMYSEGGTLLSILSDNKFLLQKAFYADILNGNTGAAFINGGDVKAFIDAFINGVGEPEPGLTQLATTVPVQTTIGQTTASFAWPAATHATSYAIYKNGSLVTTINTPNYSAVGLTAATSYTFGVVAKAQGFLNSSMGTVIVTTNQEPAPGAPILNSSFILSPSTILY